MRQLVVLQIICNKDTPYNADITPKLFIDPTITVERTDDSVRSYCSSAHSDQKPRIWTGLRTKLFMRILEEENRNRSDFLLQKIR